MRLRGDAEERFVSRRAAYSFPPYEFYEYGAEATDDPLVNYMKICEPRRSGEANATYVVLNIAQAPSRPGREQVHLVRFDVQRLRLHPQSDRTAREAGAVENLVRRSGTFQKFTS